jgi:hypothetical protein
MGEEPREVALADPAAREEHLAEASIRVLSLDESVAHVGSADDPVAHDQASEGQVAQVHGGAFQAERRAGARPEPSLERVIACGQRRVRRPGRRSG